MLSRLNPRWESKICVQFNGTNFGVRINLRKNVDEALRRMRLRWRRISVRGSFLFAGREFGFVTVGSVCRLVHIVRKASFHSMLDDTSESIMRWGQLRKVPTGHGLRLVISGSSAL